MLCQFRIITLPNIGKQWPKIGKKVNKQDQKSIDAIESNLVSEPGLIIDDN